MTESISQRYAFFQGDIVPMEEAKVGVMTHALNYGTGVFEGIRGYWNEERDDLLLLLVREHYQRFVKNTKMIFINVPYSVDELVDITLRLLRQNNYRSDVYIRPLAFKCTETIGVSMDGIADETAIIAVPYGNYVDIDRGLSVCVSSWTRSLDNSIPARGKITGNYVNSALAKNEAVRHGYDEAIVLNSQGRVAEASAANTFMVRNGVLITPPVWETILEGYTRDLIMKLAADEFGIETDQRPIDRSELYYADELFLAGTGVQLAPITSVDGHTIGDGAVGPISDSLQRLYFDVVKGRNPKYLDWLTPVYAPSRVQPEPASVQ